MKTFKNEHNDQIHEARDEAQEARLAASDHWTEVAGSDEVKPATKKAMTAALTDAGVEVPKGNADVVREAAVAAGLVDAETGALN